MRIEGGQGGARVALMVAALIGIYMVSQFFRNSVGVIAPDLAREFDLKATDLSTLSSIFFLSFAAAQIPLGVAIDRWGPKAAILATAAVMLAGAALFALAPGFYELVAGRLLIGVGCSSFYMGALAIYARQFSPERFGAMTGLQLGAGTIGTLLATAPLAAATAAWGWRGAFAGVALISAVMTLLVMIFVHEPAQARAARLGAPETLGEAIAGVGKATRVEGFWTVFLMQLVTYSPFAAVLGLWGAPWLAQTYGIGPGERGTLLFALALAQVAGLFFWGASDRWFASYKRPTLIAGFGAAAALLLAALVELPHWALLPFLVAYGFLNASSPLVTAHGKALFPTQLTARGLTLMNIGTIGGVSVQQWLTGFVIEGFGSQATAAGRVYPPEAYRAVFATMAVTLLIGLALYLRIADRHPLRRSP
ncbi:MAG: MFS transporter [Methylobacteriaceae bacterium]|nr:MFS transporter [Methylobacteriaceae bacterium]